MEPISIILLSVAGGVALFSGVGGAIWHHYRQRRLINQKISDQMVIELARENGGKVDVALLCERAHVTAREAKVKLEYLAEHKLLSKDWRDMMFGGSTYRLPNLQEENIITKFLKTKGSLSKRLESLFEANDSPKSLPAQNATGQNRDAQILSLAIENQGVTTASAVCVKLNISIDEAQKRLEELRQKQIFITEVGQNGGLVYRLVDA